MLVTALCIFRCVSANRESVQTAMKVHKIAELERSVASDMVQFKPENDEKTMELYINARRLASSTKVKETYSSKIKETDELSFSDSRRAFNSSSHRKTQAFTSATTKNESESRRMEFTLDR